MAWCHLLVDLYGCNVDSLNNKELLEKALRDLSDIMGLRIILGPILVHYAGKEGSPSGEGYSGFVVVAESHVSIHTDIRTGYASIDVYSCKEFDVQRIEEYLSQVFEPAEIEKQLILRGLMLEKAKSAAAERA
ncbi:MAG: S-adenosylmethionine decarboxylase [Aigarchaeota archaeon]|nr:S-adenosylmethionine decarboxylase [Candidatus Wolframiiraptor gerlachensis]